MDFTSQRQYMVQKQIRARGIKDAKVLEAMEEIPRHEFVPPQIRLRAYDDNSLPIGENQTISQPYMVALMTQELQLTQMSTVLEIGTGSGYQTAVLAYIAKEVYTIEYIPELSKRAQNILQELGILNVHFLIGDGSLGWPDKNIFFDAIIVTAASPGSLEHLRKNLKLHGRMVIPIGTTREHQDLTVVTKEKDSIVKKSVCPCVFVPLRGAWGNNE